MKNGMRLLSLILALILAACQLCACGGEPVPTPETTTAEATSEPAAPAVEDIVIGEDGQCSYTVIRPEKADSSSATVQRAIELRALLSEKLDGATVTISDDWTHETLKPLLPEDREILVGAVARSETAAARARIREMDFIITSANGRIVITGGCEEATDRAVKYFIDNYVSPSKGRIALPGNIDVIVRYDYKVNDPTVGGEPLSSFRVIYPAGAEKNDVLTYYSALCFSEALGSLTGIQPGVFEDSEPETEFELLIGKTNRSASAAAAAVLGDAEGKYILGADKGKVVLLGNGYFSGSAAGAFIADCLEKNLPVPALALAQPTAPAEREARSAILLIGDGMGRNHIESAYAEGIIDKFGGDLLKWTWCTTYSYSVTAGSASYTDSAAAGTALACGVKTVNGYIAKDRTGKDKKSIRDIALAAGARVSILTTDVITGATPAVFLAHNLSRKATEEIQSDIDALIANRQIDFCEGSAGDKLLDKTKESLKLISANGGSFFTMIEEAYTDKGAHNNEFATVFKAVKRINNVANYAIAFTAVHPDTVLLITADHETGGITLGSNGKYGFTVTSHTNSDVPVYGMGPGVDEFLSKDKVDNTDISKFIAKIYTSDKWGN